MASVKTLCKRGIVLQNGTQVFDGTAEEAVDYYINNNISELRDYTITTDDYRRSGPMKELEYVDVRILNDVSNMSTMEPLEVEATVKRNKSSMTECQFGVLARNEADALVWTCYSPVVELPKDKDTFKVHISIPHHNTPKGKYRLNLNISSYDYKANIRDYDIVYNPLSFEVCYIDAAHTQPFSLRPFSEGCSIHDSVVEII